MTLDACSIRLAPVWMSEQNSWQVPIVKVEMEDPDMPKVCFLLQRQSICSAIYFTCKS